MRLLQGIEQVLFSNSTSLNKSQSNELRKKKETELMDSLGRHRDREEREIDINVVTSTHYGGSAFLLVGALIGASIANLGHNNNNFFLSLFLSLFHPRSISLSVQFTSLDSSHPVIQQKSYTCHYIGLISILLLPYCRFHFSIIEQSFGECFKSLTIISSLREKDFLLRV